MGSKKKLGGVLQLFYQGFGFTDWLIFDDSKDQSMKGTTFMKQVCAHNSYYNIIKSDLHNQNPVEGFIR